MEHTHEHTHTHEHDGHVHTHSHSHVHEHDGHTHTHEDGHVHSHEHDAPTGDIEKTKALLKYMIAHNEHHNEELADLLDSLPEHAKKKMLTAIGAFEAANVDLKSVLESLE